MRLFKRLRKKINYLKDAEIEQVYQAFLLALEAHRGQKRRTGEPYVTHPIAVACILADMRMDYQAIVAALLHDVIEDTTFTKKDIAARFGEIVAEVVDGVSKLTQIEFVSRAEAQAENFRKMVMAMARDIRVIIVKLADRLHNMRTLGSLHSLKRSRIARETLDIFAPIAKRLGMRDLSVELEELGFAARFPLRHRILKDAVIRARGNRKKIISSIANTLREGLEKSHLVEWQLDGREKHLYSIYRKMSHKHLSLSEIMDVYGFRVIVNDVDACYRALGVIHQLFKPVPERFKDYIALPKANGYQSLHTTLFGPYGLPIEVQIRTMDMDRTATSGIAAHWLYKSKETEIAKQELRAQEWVKNLLELQQSAGNSLEFIESVKIDLFPDEVYVFTPRGDIMQLPAGATALDFAYIVHTDIGNSCVEIKINRQLAPLSAKLSNGQTIEVITSKKARPNPAWLDFVVTSKARSAIRHFLKTQRREESIDLGRELFKKALDMLGISFRKLPKSTIQFLLKETRKKSFDDLLEEIGLGNRMAALVAERVKAILSKEENVDVLMQKEKIEPIVIKGTEGLVVNFATCCYPIPGDPVVGIMDVGKGIMMHVETCQHITRLRRHPGRCVPLRWADDVSGEFMTKISSQVLNERGVLAIMALAVSDAGANIEDITVHDEDGLHYLVTFKLMVRNRKHLAAVMRQLRQVKQITKINRDI